MFEHPVTLLPIVKLWLLEGEELPAGYYGFRFRCMTGSLKLGFGPGSLVGDENPAVNMVAGDRLCHLQASPQLSRVITKFLQARDVTMPRWPTSDYVYWRLGTFSVSARTMMQQLTHISRQTRSI